MENLVEEKLEQTEVIDAVEEVKTTDIESDGKLDYDVILEKTKELELQTELLRKETLNLRLEREGLAVAKDFANDFAVTQDVDKQVDMIKQLVNEIKLSIGYVPKEQAKQDEYVARQQKGDAKGMIASKFSKLFK